MAAAEGSRDPGSVAVLPSGIVLGMWVGELFFGVEPRPNFLENVLVRLVFSGGAVIGGERISGVWISGLIMCVTLGAYGNGSDRSFACLNTGSNSCLSFL